MNPSAKQNRFERRLQNRRDKKKNNNDSQTLNSDDIVRPKCNLLIEINCQFCTTPLNLDHIDPKKPETFFCNHCVKKVMCSNCGSYCPYSTGDNVFTTICKKCLPDNCIACNSIMKHHIDPNDNKSKFCDECQKHFFCQRCHQESIMYLRLDSACASCTAEDIRKYKSCELGKTPSEKYYQLTQKKTPVHVNMNITSERFLWQLNGTNNCDIAQLNNGHYVAFVDQHMIISDGEHYQFKIIHPDWSTQGKRNSCSIYVTSNDTIYILVNNCYYIFTSTGSFLKKLMKPSHITTNHKLYLFNDQWIIWKEDGIDVYDIDFTQLINTIKVNQNDLMQLIPTEYKEYFMFTPYLINIFNDIHIVTGYEYILTQCDNKKHKMDSQLLEYDIDKTFVAFTYINLILYNPVTKKQWTTEIKLNSKEKVTSIICDDTNIIINTMRYIVVWKNVQTSIPLLINGRYMFGDDDIIQLKFVDNKGCIVSRWTDDLYDRNAFKIIE